MSLTHLTLNELERRAWAAGDELATEMARRVLDERDEQIDDLDFDLRVAQDEVREARIEIDTLEEDNDQLRALCDSVLAALNDNNGRWRDELVYSELWKPVIKRLDAL